MKYEFLPHTADVKFRAYGKKLDETFENAVLAFCELIGRGGKIKSLKMKKVNVSGKDKKNLFYNFLEELIYLFDAEKFIAVKAEITIRGNELKAELFGDDSSKYKDLESVKAATYAEMEVRRIGAGWVVQAVLDV